MAKEKKLFSVQAELNDRDFEDIFRVYMRYERGNEKKIGLLVSIALFLACILLTFVLSRLTLLFYGIGCAVIGLSYYLVPVNRKFLATNKLQFGEKREISFYPHQVTTMELFDDDNDDEYENSETAFSTMMLKVYENDRGFIFAEGKIVNQFLYLPKRCLSEEEIEEVRAFAQEKCSGGYHEADTMISEEDTETRAAKTDAVCDKYYGMENLRLCDDEGNRIHTEDEDAEPEENAKAHTERIEEPEMDIDAEWEKIISEDEDEE
jgi:hypothetical protein